MLCQFLLYNKVSQLCVYLYPPTPEPPSHSPPHSSSLGHCRMPSCAPGATSLESASHSNCVQLFMIPWTVAHQAPLPLERMTFYSLLQEIFPIQGLNPGLLHCRKILYHLNHQRSSRSYCKRSSRSTRQRKPDTQPKITLTDLVI